MKIELKRIPNPYTLNPTPSISGSLYAHGTHLCDTEENPLTALPAGAYQIIRHYCKQYGRKMPIITALGCDGVGSMEYGVGKRIPNPYTLNPTPCCEQCEPLAFVSNNTTMPCICPMLKPGNGTHHRADGSIILGTRIIPGCLSHPLQAFNPLAERIRKAIARGHKVHLVIKDDSAGSMVYGVGNHPDGNSLIPTP